MKSIQGRLTVYIVAGTALLLVAAGIAVDRVLSEQLESEFDRNLLAKAMTLVSLTDQERGVVEFDFSEEFMPEFGEDAERQEYFELWLDDGSTLARSGSLGENAGLTRSPSANASPVFAHVELPDGRAGKSVQILFVPREDLDDEDEEDAEAAGREAADAAPGAEPVSEYVKRSAGLVLAKGRGELDQLLVVTRTTLAVAFLSLMAALAVLARVSVNQGLKPLKRIAKEVEGLDANNLHVRLTTDPGSDELRPITRQLNHLLGRLDEAFQREKRFSGNVAHELRTPIAELRALAEVGKEWPNERAMVEGFFGDLVDLADDMERTVVNLLMLARLDAGTQVVELEAINVAQLLDKIWRRLRLDADGKHVELDNRISGRLTVRSDKDKLTLILVNLLSNAVTYSAERSKISIEAQHTDTGIVLAVSNLAMDLNERDLSLIFERFWRKDQARSGGHHAGLGLSLVKALADVLNLKIHPLLDSKKRFTMAVSGLMPV